MSYCEDTSRQIQDTVEGLSHSGGLRILWGPTRRARGRGYGERGLGISAKVAVPLTGSEVIKFYS